MPTTDQDQHPEKQPEKRAGYCKAIIKALVASLTVFIIGTGLFNVFTHQTIGSVLFSKTLELEKAINGPPELLIIPPFSKASIQDEQYALVGTQPCPPTTKMPERCIIFPIHSEEPISQHIMLLSASTHQIAHAKVSLKFAGPDYTILNVEALAAEHDGSVYITHFTEPYPALSTQQATTEYGGPPPQDLKQPHPRPLHDPKNPTYNF